MLFYYFSFTCLEKEEIDCVPDLCEGVVHHARTHAHTHTHTHTHTSATSFGPPHMWPMSVVCGRPKNLLRKLFVTINFI